MVILGKKTKTNVSKVLDLMCPVYNLYTGHIKSRTFETFVFVFFPKITIILPTSPVGIQPVKTCNSMGNWTATVKGFDQYEAASNI